MAIILPANTLAAGGFSVDNSCRFNGDAYLHKTVGTPTNADKYTLSVWIKRSILTSFGPDNAQYIMSYDGGGNPREHIRFNDSTDTLNWYFRDSGGTATNLTTTQEFRDVSAWYNFQFVYDSGQAVAANRQKIYCNGTQITSFSSSGYVAQDTDSNLNSNVSVKIGAIGTGSPSVYSSQYLSEVVFLDGQTLAASNFGEYDEDSPTIWKPKDVSTLTFGDNGFYLDFEASDNLGNDANGGTDWTEVSLAADDQCLDSPTNNFCTLNPLDVVASSITFAHGNTQAFWASTAAWRSVFGTMAPSSGKWYYEVIGGNSSGHLHAAIVSPEYAALLGPTLEISTTNAQPSYSIYGANGSIYYSNTSGAGNSSSYAGGDPHNTHTDYIGCYFDLDNNKLYFAKNGTVLASGTGFDIEAGFAYMPGFSLYNQTAAGTGVNFGNGNFLGTAISGTTYNDANGYGIFKYDPSAGTFDGGSKEFLALCTKNLAEYG